MPLAHSIAMTYYLAKSPCVPFTVSRVRPPRCTLPPSQTRLKPSRPLTPSLTPSASASWPPPVLSGTPMAPQMPSPPSLRPCDRATSPGVSWQQLGHLRPKALTILPWALRMTRSMCGSWRSSCCARCPAQTTCSLTSPHTPHRTPCATSPTTSCALGATRSPPPSPRCSLPRTDVARRCRLLPWCDDEGLIRQVLRQTPSAHDISWERLAFCAPEIALEEGERRVAAAANQAEKSGLGAMLIGPLKHLVKKHPERVADLLLEMRPILHAYRHYHVIRHLCAHHPELAARLLLAPKIFAEFPCRLPRDPRADGTPLAPGSAA